MGKFDQLIEVLVRDPEHMNIGQDIWNRIFFCLFLATTAF